MAKKNRSMFKTYSNRAMGEMADKAPVADECLGEMLTDQEAIEIREKIPLNPLATEELIKSLKGDDPMDCIFRVYFRENNKGWVYDDSAYDDIVNTILTANLFVPCCYGHQAQDAVAYEGRPLMGTVIGALLDKVGGFVYYRIIPDAGDGAKDIRRWLKNKQINAVSIWGFPTIMQIAGKTHVVGYRLLSVDFVPPFTEGQKNDVSIGEMELSHEQMKNKIQAALRKKYPDDDSWVWVEETYDSYIIAECKSEYYKIPYTETDGNISLGDAAKVRRVISYEPVQEDKMELKDFSNDALLIEISARAREGRFIAPDKVAGEMGLALEKPDEMKKLKGDSEELARLKAAAGEMGLEKAIETAKVHIEEKAASEKAKAFGEMVDTLKKDKGLIDKDGKATGEMNALVDKFARFNPDMTREQVAGEMDRIINDETMQKLVAGNIAKPPVGEMGTEKAPEVLEV